MGVFDKVKFWKKDDDFGLSNPETPSYDLGNPGQSDPLAYRDPLTMNDPLAQDPQAGFSQQYPNYPPSTPFPGSMGQQRSVPQEQYPPMEQQPMQGQGIHQRDVELILAKLDALKSEMDALHQRVKKIEQATDAQSSAQQQQKKYW